MTAKGGLIWAKNAPLSVTLTSSTLPSSSPSL